MYLAYDLNNQTHIHQLFLFKANDTMNVELVDFSPLLTGLFIFLYRHVCLKINILTLTDKQTLTNTRTRTPNSKTFYLSALFLSWLWRATPLWSMLSSPRGLLICTIDLYQICSHSHDRKRGAYTHWAVLNEHCTMCTLSSTMSLYLFWPRY